MSIFDPQENYLKNWTNQLSRLSGCGSLWLESVWLALLMMHRHTSVTLDNQSSISVYWKWRRIKLSPDSFLNAHIFVGPKTKKTTEVESFCVMAERSAVERFWVKDCRSKVTAPSAGWRYLREYSRSSRRKETQTERGSLQELPAAQEWQTTTHGRQSCRRCSAPWTAHKYFPLVYLPTSKATEEFLIVRFSSRHHGRRVKNKKRSSLTWLTAAGKRCPLLVKTSFCNPNWIRLTSKGESVETQRTRTNCSCVVELYHELKSIAGAKFRLLFFLSTIFSPAYYQSARAATESW